MKKLNSQTGKLQANVIICRNALKSISGGILVGPRPHLPVELPPVIDGQCPNPDVGK